VAGALILPNLKRSQRYSDLGQGSNYRSYIQYINEIAGKWRSQ